MTTKLAIDWSESELRLVVAECGSSKIKVTAAAVVPIENGNVVETLRSVITDRGLQKTETLVAIGRGKAELRELKLPPVPDEELPDMVRFQAIRSFASSGDTATVDFLVTKRADSGVEVIAAAVGPQDLTEVRQTCQAAELSLQRISLRPLAAAALYLQQHRDTGDVVLIDLLADDAEIVIARNGSVIFVRTVRMPADEAARGTALAAELRRSLVACGSRETLGRVVLWGRESIHVADQAMLTAASGSPVDVVNPFDLIAVSRQANEQLPDHIGRLAPLIGLLAADHSAPERLIDFLNPRQRPEEKQNPYRQALFVGIPMVAVALIGWLMFRQFRLLDSEIDRLKAANNDRQANVDLANESIRRTAVVDSYLDGNVNWLDELRRLANSMPPSEQMIVRSINAAVDDRSGGGTMTIVGGATEPEVIVQFERALRDETHRVTGDGAGETAAIDDYRWKFSESISIDGSQVRQTRYRALDALNAAEAP
jgi:Tfp pilus assembly PilM family ATPase